MAISGKPREVCVQALAAAFGDPDRAFQYLTDGIPQQMLNPMAGQMPAAEDNEESYGNEEGVGGAPQGLAALMEMA